MELYREKIKDLENWSNSSNRKPLLIFGSRQVGKTYLVEELFAKNFFKDKYIKINFMTDYDIKNRLDGIKNSNIILKEISSYFKKQINEDWLIIFDEIQEIPSLRTALKSFNEENKKYRIISLGSYLGNKMMLDKEGFPVGQVDIMTINPLSFKEFLINSNRDWLIEEIENNLDNLFNKNISNINKTSHKILLEEFKSFLTIGGLPEPLSLFFENKNSNECLLKRKAIQESYLIDLTKYIDSNSLKAKTINIYNSIGKFFNKQNNVFIMSNIEKKSAYKNYKNAFDWLLLTNLIYKVNLLEKAKTKTTIIGNTNEKKFKIYFNDFGFIGDLFPINYKNFWNSSGIEGNIKGSLGENFAFCELANSGVDVNNSTSYYRFNENNKYYEIDLLIEDLDYNLIPVEIKMSQKFSKQSLNLYIKLFKPKYAIVFSFNEFNMYKKDGCTIYNLPIYSIGFLKFKNNRLNIISD